MSKHTPGEWFVRSPEGTLVYSRDDEGSICQLKFLKGRHGLGGRRDPDEVDANANLIAAAPELLKTLKLFEPLIEQAVLNGVCDKESFRQYKAIIAKAEGRS